MARPRVDATGKKYGDFTAIEIRSIEKSSGRSLWLFRCECGSEFVGRLRANKCNTCHPLVGVSANHAKKRSGAYRSWQSMLTRCLNQACPAYSRYGGRGISICDRWRNSFSEFFSDMGDRPIGTSLDRINNDGNYEPANCRWSTPGEQSRNKSSTRLITIEGTTKCITDWAKEYGLSVGCIDARIARGLTGAGLISPRLRKRTADYQTKGVAL